MRIYFFVDRRGFPVARALRDQHLPFRAQIPFHINGPSLREPQVRESQGDIEARARILEDRGSSPRPVLIPWGWLLSEQLGWVTSLINERWAALLTTCHGLGTPA